MVVKDILNFFGTWAEAARELRMGHNTLQTWKRKGFIPIRSQHRIERFTDGALKADVDHDFQLFDGLFRDDCKPGSAHQGKNKD